MNTCGLSYLIARGLAGNVLAMDKRSITDDLAREERPVVAMALILGLLYAASFGVTLAAPELPSEIHEALACLPSFLTS
jgi:hypothetical protein